jgi:hypothetical protein
LDYDHKSEILLRIQANAISAAPGHNLREDSLLYHVTPRDPFPPHSITILLTTLEEFQFSTASWVKNTSILLFQITREATHGRRLLSEPEVSRIINLIWRVAAEEVASHLFWVLTSLVADSAANSDSRAMLVVTAAGVLGVLHYYCEKYGLTPADVQAWAMILRKLPVFPKGVMPIPDLLDFISAKLQSSTSAQLMRLHDIRAPLLQFSREPIPDPCNLQPALQCLQATKDTIGQSWAVIRDDSKPLTDAPHTILPMQDQD